MGRMYPRESTYKKRGSGRVLTTRYGYKNFEQVLYLSAKEVSNNKKHWWIYQYMMYHAPINWSKKKDG